MSETTVSIDTAEFRLFISREASQYRAFWFCPYGDCYGSFRSERLVPTKDEAIRLATTAAQRHHDDMHASAQDWFQAAMSEADVGRLRVHG